MPCYTGPITEEERKINGMLPEQHAAVLCGIISAVGIEILDRVDWKEVGVSKELVLRWWALHQRDDEERKQREERKGAAAKNKAEIDRLEKELKALRGG
jgi:hypothetical protein